MGFFAVLAVAATVFSLLTPTEWSGHIAEAPVFDSAFVMSDDSAGIFGNLTVCVGDGLSLPYAELLINHSPAGDFREGRLTVRVYPGDKLTVDLRAYPQTLSFYIDSPSASIDLSQLALEGSGSGSLLPLGTVTFK